MNRLRIQDSRLNDTVGQVGFRNGIMLIFILISYFLLPTSIHAQSVDLLWQGETYTPPFYQGKTLWSNQSGITLVAMPQGLGNQANLNYKWSKNGTVLGNINGVGKNTLPYIDTVLSRPQTIKLEIFSLDDDLLATNSIVITPSPPSVLIYEKNPLYGFMFHKEVSKTYPLSEREVTFTAFPLFFSALDRLNPGLTYEWRTNTGETEIRNSVTYRTLEGLSGSSLVSVNLANQDKIMQTSKKSFLIQFGKQ